MGRRVIADIWHQSSSSKIIPTLLVELLHDSVSTVMCACRMGGVSGPQLSKADIFSLGLSIYEVARLRRYL